MYSIKNIRVGTEEYSVLAEKNPYIEKVDPYQLEEEALERARQDGNIIVLVQGSWDLFHLGHLRYILQARSYGDYLIIGVDSDSKIQKRKGPARPIINEDTRFDFINLLKQADDIVIKDPNEPKWGLIKKVRPDKLVVIQENYTEEQIEELKKYCGEVIVLDKQAKESTSDIVRTVYQKEQRKKADKVIQELNIREQVAQRVEEFKKRIGYSEDSSEITKLLVKAMAKSTDWITPVGAAYKHNGEWITGSNQVDLSLPINDLKNRTELFYNTCDHAEIQLIRNLGYIEKFDGPLYVTLMPCDMCMKTLIDKGVKEVYYFEDHPEKGWSKRTHERAKKANVKLIPMIKSEVKEEQEQAEPFDFSGLVTIYPPNARRQPQLDTMTEFEEKGQDPMDPNLIEQKIILRKKHWYITENKYPYENAQTHLLLVANDPIYDINKISQEMWAELLEIILELNVDYDITGGALCFRYGDPAKSGASLKRLHAHIIQPQEDKKVRFPIGGYKTLQKGLKINKKQ